MFPQVRNLAGAVFVFVFALYPYVYLLVRTALAERAAQLMEAARLLGAPLARRIAAVAVPLARPAIAAGVALALMETLADFGVASYFGIQTFSTGIYKAWLAMDNRIAAAQLATVLPVVWWPCCWRWRRARRSACASPAAARGGAEARPVPLVGAARIAAWCVCTLPCCSASCCPLAFMLRPLAADWSVLPWDRFLQWSFHSLRLAGLSAALAVLLAVLLAFRLRRTPAGSRAAWCIWRLGYAVPGAVLVVGLLLPSAGCRRPGRKAAWATG